MVVMEMEGGERRLGRVVGDNNGDMKLRRRRRLRNRKERL